MPSLSEANLPAVGRDPRLGDAIERVVDAGQTLIVRRMDLLVEELSTLGSNLLSALTHTFLGSVAALVGWFIAVIGVVDVLDDYFARSAVEIAVGLLHVAAGVAIIRMRQQPEKASS